MHSFTVSRFLNVILQLSVTKHFNYFPENIFCAFDANKMKKNEAQMRQQTLSWKRKMDAKFASAKTRRQLLGWFDKTNYK